jgi:hypothetical protein
MLTRFPAVCLLCFLPYATSNACEIRWPDSEINIPPLVQKYIQDECNKYVGTTEESLAKCIDGEEYGYRAVVGMLSDPLIGKTAAQRYRACAAGLGDFGGRFHRRKAECIGSNLNFIWRFEFSLRT